MAIVIPRLIFVEVFFFIRQAFIFNQSWPPLPLLWYASGFQPDRIQSRPHFRRLPRSLPGRLIQISEKFLRPFWFHGYGMPVNNAGILHLNFQSVPSLFGSPGRVGAVLSAQPKPIPVRPSKPKHQCKGSHNLLRLRPNLQ